MCFTRQHFHFYGPRIMPKKMVTFLTFRLKGLPVNVAQHDTYIVCNTWTKTSLFALSFDRSFSHI